MVLRGREFPAFLFLEVSYFAFELEEDFIFPYLVEWASHLTQFDVGWSQSHNVKTALSAGNIEATWGSRGISDIF